MLIDARKLFSITTVYDPEFVFPGSHLPGPEAPRLTEQKTIDDKVYAVGDFDPEWRRPDTENIFLGEIDGRFYYSIRADITTEDGSMGEFTENIDPQTHETVTEDLFNALARSPYISDVFKNEGYAGTAETRFNIMFPDAQSLKSALQSNPGMVEQFIATEQETNETVLGKLGIVKE